MKVRVNMEIEHETTKFHLQSSLLLENVFEKLFLHFGMIWSLFPCVEFPP